MELRRLTVAAMMAAAALISFVYMRIEIPMFFGLTTKVYLGYTFILMAGLLTGRWYGALAGAIGLTMADLLAGYVTSAFPTFLSFLIMGYVAGAMADKLRPTQGESSKMVMISCTTSLILFGLAEPLIRSTFKYFVLGYPLEMAIGSAGNVLIGTIFSGVPSLFLVGILYPAIRRALPLQMKRLIATRL